MSNPFFDRPILNSPYVRPLRHWELDTDGQPTQKIIETRRRAEFITPIPKPKTRKGSPDQQKMVFDDRVTGFELLAINEYPRRSSPNQGSGSIGPRFKTAMKGRS